MILVIPSIQLINGECKDIISGISAENDIFDVFKQNPNELIKLWRRENAKSIHINNIDSFQCLDKEKNLEIIHDFSEQTDIPISLFHYFADVDTCVSVLESGIYRVFAGTLLLDDINSSKELLKEYGPSRICGNIITDGINSFFHDKTTIIPLNDILKIFKEIGIQRILYNSTFSLNDIRLDDIIQIASINTDYNFRITINGGAIKPKDLWKLNDRATGGIDSIIIGRALYQNNFPCQKIWRMVEEELEPHIVKSQQ